MRKYLTIKPSAGPPTPSGRKRRIDFTSAWDKRDDGYGLHGVEMRWYIVGPEGAVQFVVFTGWMPVGPNLKPMPADVGYHAREPHYEGHEPMGPCDLLGGDECYYDGSGLHADEMFKTLLAEGGDAVWKKLDDYYESVFYDE